MSVHFDYCLNRCWTSVPSVVSRPSKAGKYSILTLYDNVSMAWGERSSRKEQLTLALNILGHFLPSAEIRLLRGYSSKMALLLYKALAEEVVWTMPLQGGRIPLDELEEWVQRKVAVCDIGADR
jgi:hypothetical protein